MGFLSTLGSVVTTVARASDSYQSTQRVLSGRGSFADGLSMVGDNSDAERMRAVGSALNGDVGGSLIHSLNADAFEDH
jgi:hypothetical protein